MYTSGGQVLTVFIRNFPGLTRTETQTDELSVTIDGSAQLVQSVTGNDFESVLIVVVPPMKNVGVYDVSVSSLRYRHLGAVHFGLVYEVRPPVIIPSVIVHRSHPIPSIGPLGGSDIVDLKMFYLTPLVSADDISVVNVNQDVAWPVGEILYSDRSGTYIRVAAPPSAKAGRMNVRVTHQRTQETMYFQYEYVDTSITVLKPGAECFDGGDDTFKLAALGPCITRGALESPMRPHRACGERLPCA